MALWLDFPDKIVLKPQLQYIDGNDNFIYYITDIAKSSKTNLFTVQNDNIDNILYKNTNNILEIEHRIDKDWPV